MNNSLELLQDLQEAYAFGCDMTIFITDLKGEYITQPSNVTPCTSLFLQETNSSLSIHYKQVLDMFPSIAKPIICELHPGIKIVLAPVKLNNKTLCYVWAGVFIESNTCDVVLAHVSSNFNLSKTTIDVLSGIKDFTHEQQMQLLNRIRNMTEIISQYLSLKTKAFSRKKRLSIVNKFVNQTRAAYSEWEGQLDLLTSISAIDFVGIATKADSETFCVSRLIGQYQEDLVGVDFFIGEGFLGYVAATGRFGFWSDVASDPRSLFFAKRNMFPRVLFCYPLKIDKEVVALLFGGGSQRTSLDIDDLQMIQTFGAILEVMYANQSSYKILKDKQGMSRILFDLGKELVNSQNLTECLRLLVRFCQEITGSAFSCIIYNKSKNENRIEAVAKGITGDKIQVYSNEVANRYIRPRSEIMYISEEYYERHTDLGNVEEYPIVFQNRVQGVLAAEKTMTMEPSQRKFLSSICMISGFIIHAIQMMEDLLPKEDMIRILHKTISESDPQKYELTLQASNLSRLFSKTIGLSDSEMSLICNACLLVPFSPEFIKEEVGDIRISKIVQGFADFMTSYKATSENDLTIMKEIQILILVFHYLSNEEQIKNMNLLDLIDPVLYKQFKAFIVREKSAQEDLLLYQEPEHETYDEFLLIERIKKVIPFSERECDVLRFVIQGLANREIAKKLFISEHTVKNHLTKIFQKMQVTDRQQAISKIYQFGHIKNRKF